MQTEDTKLLRFGILQLDIEWENIENNIEIIGKAIADQKDKFDILLLPEMFATGFSMAVEQISQTMEGSIVTWMKQQSNLHQIGIMGTVSIKENNNYYNRAIFIYNDTISFYDKRHLFSMGEEDTHYSAGDKRVVFDYKGVKILPVICYDIRFPVWLRNKNDYDLMICMANWPKARVAVWDTLLQARAIENQSYIIGVNRIGTGDGLQYNGNSAFIDSKGKLLLKVSEQSTVLYIAEVDIEAQNNFREKFPVLNDADEFEISN